jgi:hypothetical protein
MDMNSFENLCWINEKIRKILDKKPTGPFEFLGCVFTAETLDIADYLLYKHGGVYLIVTRTFCR